MKYTNKPTKNSSVSPPIILPYYCSNSFYRNRDKYVYENGYWTNTIYDKNTSYAIDLICKNMISLKTNKYGIRPVLNIKKSLLVPDSGVIPITDIITNGTKIDFEYDKTLYDGFIFKGLQGFTVTKDKLVFMCASGNIIENSVMHSYYLNNLSKLYKRKYNKTGHGNGMTYNSKTNKVLLVGPGSYNIVFEYKGQTLEKEKEYSYPTFPKSSAIGYNYDNDLYIGKGVGSLFLLITTDFKKVYEFSYFTF